jgi:hypothetical protein
MAPDYKTDIPSFWAVDTPKTLCSYADPIAINGPTPMAPADEESIAVNPITGRAYNISFTWERYHNKYIISCHIQIATDPDFEAMVRYVEATGIDSDIISRVIGPTGGGTTASPSLYVAEFMPGTTYYWRTRVSDTTYGPLESPWSETRSFNVESTTEFMTASPEVGATGVSLTPTLTWTEYAEATSYEVAVAEDETFAILDVSHSATETFYKVEKALKYSTTYYWRVRAEGGEWATGVFTTMAEPEEPTPPVVIEPTPPTEVTVVEVPVQGPPQAIPNWMLLTIIGIGAVLVIALIVLIVRTRRVV